MILRIQLDRRARRRGSRWTAWITRTLNSVWKCWPKDSIKISAPICRRKNKRSPDLSKSWRKNISTGRWLFISFRNLNFKFLFWHSGWLYSSELFTPKVKPCSKFRRVYRRYYVWWCQSWFAGLKAKLRLKEWADTPKKKLSKWAWRTCGPCQHFLVF